MENTIQYLETLIRETRKPEAEVITKAFQIGLRQLWREHILGRYLRHEISRDEAIESVHLIMAGSNMISRSPVLLGTSPSHLFHLILYFLQNSP